MILIVASHADSHSQCVKQELLMRGKGAIIFDPEELACGASVAICLGDRRSASLTTVDNQTVKAHEVRSVWYRRPRPPKLSHTAFSETDRSFARAELLNAFDGFLTSTDANFINPVHSQQSCSKPAQLLVAHQLGIPIPSTLITNNAANALEFVSRHEGNVIHKAMTPSRRQLLETKRWSIGDAVHLGQLYAGPTIFQQMIEGPADIRVTVFGSNVFAAYIESASEGHVDSRLDMKRRYLPYDLPETVKGSLLALMGRLGLIFATADFKMNERGEHIFLEINPQGQFLYIEILTGLPLVSAMAELLARD
jgi:glutathione synthase/RimK-type ligase-like ATP-grasp enzyme